VPDPLGSYAANGVILVGGGLANGLIAYRLATTRPDVRLRLIEGEDRLGGRHTWSFHTGDLLASEREWLAPLVERSWESYDVRFPGLKRRLTGGYHSVTSERFHDAITRALGDRVRLGTRVEGMTPHAVLVQGEELRASCVIDGRGFPPDHGLALGYQTFLGQRVRLRGPHALDAPLLMDATVPQQDGFRFLYALPWDERSLLLEDTRYSESPDLDRPRLRAEIADYAATRGWAIEDVVTEEEGILPIPMGGSVESFLDLGAPGVPKAGMRAALFHATTGYSLPDAVRLADALAALPSYDSETVAALVRRRAVEGWNRGRFFRFLNRMLFKAADPDLRFKVLERFYRLPEATIRRFYSGTLTTLDRVRLLTGKPPVPIARAARCLFESKIPA
jgi:lycopene beta-cyclase